MLVLNLPAFKKKYTAYGRFHENGPYGKILTKKEPIRTLRFAVPHKNAYYCVKAWSDYCYAKYTDRFEAKYNEQ